MVVKYKEGGKTYCYLFLCKALLPPVSPEVPGSDGGEPPKINDPASPLCLGLLLLKWETCRWGTFWKVHGGQSETFL